MDEDGQGAPVGPDTLEDGGLDGVVPSGCPGHGVSDIDDVHEGYERLKQEILSWVSNKMSIRSGPVPMDIGRVDGGIPRSGSAWTRLATVRSATISKAGGTLPASARLTGAAKRKARSRVWTRELARVAREAETVGQKEKPKGTKARATRVAELDTRLGSAAHATSTQSRKRVRERWSEVVDVGTIWNVGHVETVDVMAVFGGETPTNKFLITLDSGAGASCWPAEWMPGVPMKPKQPGVKFRAANGDEL